MLIAYANGLAAVCEPPSPVSQDYSLKFTWEPRILTPPHPADSSFEVHAVQAGSIENRGDASYRVCLDGRFFTWFAAGL